MSLAKVIQAFRESYLSEKGLEPDWLVELQGQFKTQRDQGLLADLERVFADDRCDLSEQEELHNKYSYSFQLRPRLWSDFFEGWDFEWSRWASDYYKSHQEEISPEEYDVLLTRILAIQPPHLDQTDLPLLSSTIYGQSSEKRTRAMSLFAMMGEEARSILEDLVFASCLYPGESKDIQVAIDKIVQDPEEQRLILESIAADSEQSFPVRLQAVQYLSGIAPADFSEVVITVLLLGLDADPHHKQACQVIGQWGALAKPLLPALVLLHLKFEDTEAQQAIDQVGMTTAQERAILLDIITPWQSMSILRRALQALLDIKGEQLTSDDKERLRSVYYLLIGEKERVAKDQIAELLEITPAQLNTDKGVYLRERKENRTPARGAKVAIPKSMLDKQIAESTGLLADLNQMTDSSIFGTGGFDSSVSNALGGLIGSQYGNQYGSGGLGSRDSGFGGGGTAAGLGGLGTRGSGIGGYGITGVGVGDPIILGALDKSLIERVVQLHLAQMRYCYQKELAKNPKLFGKIVVKFVIAQDGTVSSSTVKSSTMGNPICERCITDLFLKMEFPKPKGDGIVIVSYPFSFSAEKDWGGGSGYGRGVPFFYGQRSGDDPGVGTGDPIILGALDKSAIDRVVKANLAPIRSCYKKELEKNPHLFGKIVVKFTIAKDGTVSSATVKSSTMNNSVCESCITALFLKMKFPKPKGDGVVIVSYPFVFNSQGD